MNFTAKKIQINQNQIMTYHIDKGHANTLLLIHGGPGSTSLSLRETHGFYSEHGFNILTWDQLGCGESDQPDHDEHWHLDYFVEELKSILDHYGLQQVHILGRSWGGILAQAFLVQHPERVQSIILGGTTPSCPLMQKGFERIKMSLGLTTFNMMNRREFEGSTAHPEYKAAIDLLLYRHFCRLELWPDALKKMLSATSKRVMHSIFGKYLFNCSGSIKDFDCTAALSKLDHRALIMHGEHDYISLDCAKLLRDSLKNSEVAMLENCSHMAFYENPDLYHGHVLRFLESTQGSTS